jgi:prefoldin subunit 4
MSTPAALQHDTDVHISRENQKKINTFAIRNGWMEELTVELKAKQNDLKNLEDAEAEIMLQDDTSSVPIFIGESYVHFNQDKASEVVEELMKRTKEEISSLESKIDEVRREMSSLKSELYSKFGDNINLENEED